MTPLLILIPTDFELQKLQPLLTDSVKRAGGVIATCGFGPIVAGIRTTQLLAFYKPRAVVVVGIAGALGPQLPIGTATFFRELRVTVSGLAAVLTLKLRANLAGRSGPIRSSASRSAM